MESERKVLLLVEDEFILQVQLVEPLEEAGFAVLTETKGATAIETYQQKASEICALITDVTLADATTGWEVAHKARELNSHLPVIYTTSYTSETWAANGVPNSVHVMKPFVAVQVITALAQLLNSGADPGP